jgi:hypothetical protein
MGPLNCLEEEFGATSPLSSPLAGPLNDLPGAFEGATGLTDSLLPLVAGGLYDLSDGLSGAIYRLSPPLDGALYDLPGAFGTTDRLSPLLDGALNDLSGAAGATIRLSPLRLMPPSRTAPDLMRSTLLE